MPAALARLKVSYPAINVTFTEAEPPESLPMLLSGDVDLVLAFEFNNASAEDDLFDSVPLLTDPFYSVLPRDHRLAKAKRVDLGELANDVWIAGCERCRANLLEACSAAAFEPKVAMATDDYVTVQALVAAGQGVAMLPALILAAHCRPDVTIRPIRNAPRRVVDAVLLGAERRAPAVEAFLEALKESSAAIVAGHAGALGVQLN